MRVKLKVVLSILLKGALLWSFVGCASSSGTGSTNMGTIATVTTLSSSASSVATGVGVTLTATVSPNPGSGTVTFYDGSTMIAPATLSNGGTATLITTFATSGTQTLTATFAATSLYQSSTSSPVNVTVTAGSTSPAPGPATFVYVIQDPYSGTPQVLQFTAGANGTVAPVATLTMPTGFEINSIATDSTGQLYVAGNLASGAAVIEIFAAGASGTATAVRTITIVNGYAPTGMAVSLSGSLYAVDGDGELTVYSSTASGMTTPERLITGTMTGLSYPQSVAVDTSGNIYVAEAPILPALPSILVFSATANGNVAPSRTITNVNAFVGVAVDANGNLYATVDTATTPYSASIVEYASGANGAATPTRTISGTATGLATAGGLCVDGAGNIFVANQSANGTSYYGSSYSYSLEEFAPTATGNVAPMAELTSTSWTTGGAQIALK